MYSQYAHSKPAEVDVLGVYRFIGKRGRGERVILPSTINSERYIQVLDQALIPFLDQMPLRKRVRLIFQQDNAPFHRARQNMQYLEDQSLTVSDWPALSPDINPIEHVWALMKREIRRQRPQTIAHLQAAIYATWEKIVTPKLCTRLFRSLPGRIERILKARGLRIC